VGAICEAVSRPVPGLDPGMRFVPIKTVEQQADAMTHKARQILIKQRTMAMNSLRSLMAEFGIVVPQGPQHIGKLLAILADPEDTTVAAVARTALNAMSQVLSTLEMQIGVLDKDIRVRARTDVTARRLDTIPGFGPIFSSAIAAIVTDPRHFDSGRDFAASLGLVPRQDGTGGKVKLGPISKRGNGYWSLSSGRPDRTARTEALRGCKRVMAMSVNRRIERTLPNVMAQRDPEAMIRVRSTDPIRASGLVPRSKAGHMTASDCTCQNAKKTLANRGPSTHDGFAVE
jgi:transposase